MPEIPTVPTTVQQAFAQMERLVARVEALPVEQLFTSSVGAVDAVRGLAESPQLRQALTNLDAVVRDTRTLVTRLEAQVGPVAGSARQTLDEARLAVADLRGVLVKTVRELDEQLDPLVANTDQALQATRALMLDTQRLVRQTTEMVGPLAASATSTAEAARVTLEKAQGTLANADGFLTEETPLGYQLGQTLGELTEAARSIRVLADAPRAPAEQPGLRQATREYPVMAAPIVRALAGAALVALMALGCAPATLPTRFYVLTAVPPAGGAPAAARDVAVGVGPIALPGYLDRPQIVTRTGGDEIDLAEFDQWGEPLRSAVPRVLADNLAARVPTERVVLFPWRGVRTVQYQVPVEILRFEGKPGGRGGAPRAVAAARRFRTGTGAPGERGDREPPAGRATGRWSPPSAAPSPP